VSATRVVLAGILTLAVLGASVHAADTKTYQVTGPVLQITDTMIVVQKGSEKWEIARDPSTKVTGDLKVGAKVTIQYRMTAAAVEVKPEKPAGKPGKATKTKG
jgi:hypothetical protein